MAREPHRSSEILDAVALLVVDMQDAFLNVMPDRDSVLRRTALAIDAARAFGLKVIFTEQVPQKLGPTHADLLALAPDARVFAKSEFSALLAEGLQEYLRRINVYHLLIAGVETPICIYQTALHAQDHDFDVTLLSDCTTGRRPDDCLVVLEALSRAEVHVLPAETVFYSMLGSSLNPRFAHFTRIVKRFAGEDPISGGPTPAPEVEPRPDQPQRHAGGRHGERHPRRDRHEHGARHREEVHPDSGDEFSETSGEEVAELATEDGISAAEAEQPSYEEATAEHSAVESGDEEHVPTAMTEDGDEADSTEAEDADGGSDERPADETGEGEPRKRRPRRRRGGARRRRARERAAAAAQGGNPGDAPAGERPPGGDAGEPPRERSSESADTPPAP